MLTLTALLSLSSRLRVHRASLVSMSAAQIEVERKFQAPPDHAALAERIVANGGAVVGTKSFTDTYYDSTACVLTRRDMWLRCRDGAWELKLPIEDDARRSGGERTVFREIEGTDAVAEALQTLLPGTSGPEALESLIEAAGLEPFAEFSTTRSQYKLGRASIDADIASFGHSVMEIEVMCTSASEVAAAEAEIARVAELCGATPLSGAMGGKLETFIRQHCPNVLAQLIDVGILQKS